MKPSVFASVSAAPALRSAAPVARASSAALREMAAAVGGTDVAARQWVDEGFSPGDAQAYVAAGCFDVGRTVALRQAGISALQMARSGLGWDYSSGSVSLAELCGLVQAAPSAQGVLVLE